jgi:hypothetical protein
MTYGTPLALVFVIPLLIVGCTSVHQRADGTYDVPRTVEVRSPFGTNAGFVKLEHCLTKTNDQFGFSGYTDCHGMKKWTPTQSQGQGGQVAAGAMIGLGFGLGAAFAPTSSTSASSVSNSSAVSTVGKGHH